MYVYDITELKICYKTFQNFWNFVIVGDKLPVLKTYFLPKKFEVHQSIYQTTDTPLLDFW